MAAKKVKKAGFKVNRRIKDSFFCALFGELKNAIELVNALLGTNYGVDANAEIATLKNVFTGGVINDLSILLDDVLLVLIEHQSTVCGNMPLRMLEYVTATYKRFINDENVYSRRKINLPRPVFIVLYNGTEKMGNRELHRLSDSYSKAMPTFNGLGSLELEVTIININDPRNKNLVKTCKLLDGYRIFNNMLNNNKKTLDREAVITKTINDCIARGVLKDFLEKNRKGLTTMLIRQWSHQDELRAAEKVGRNRGREEGIGIGVKITALAMKKDGMPVKDISRLTGLSASTVRRLSDSAETPTPPKNRLATPQNTPKSRLARNLRYK
jgi:predicted transposase/invertase (TIGR01784 family)